MIDAEAIDAFKALAQPTRMALYRALRAAGPEGLAAGRIAEALDVPPPTLSFHLKEMTAARLIDARRDGRRVIYSLNERTIGLLADFLQSEYADPRGQANGAHANDDARAANGLIGSHRRAPSSRNGASLD